MGHETVGLRPLTHLLSDSLIEFVDVLRQVVVVHLATSSCCTATAFRKPPIPPKPSWVESISWRCTNLRLHVGGAIRASARRRHSKLSRGERAARRRDHRRGAATFLEPGSYDCCRCPLKRCVSGLAELYLT